MEEIVFTSHENRADWYLRTPMPKFTIGRRYRVANTHFEGPTYLWGETPDRYCLIDNTGNRVWVGSCQVKTVQENRTAILETILG